jgi:hypothetical protein
MRMVDSFCQFDRNLYTLAHFALVVITMKNLCKQKNILCWLLSACNPSLSGYLNKKCSLLLQLNFESINLLVE